jgi:hypothetical protein
MFHIMKTFIFLSGVVLFLGVSLHHAHAQTSDEVKTLRTTLLASYDKDVLPRADQTDKVAVSVALTLLSINDFDMIKQKLSVTGYLTLEWTDEFMAWDSAASGGIANLSFPQTKLWKPDISLKNSFTKIEELGGSFIYMNVDSTGSVVWQPFEVFQTNCDADISYFPFDRQSCNLDFETWSFSTSNIVIKKVSNAIIVENIETNAEWSIEQTKASDTQGTANSVKFTIVMRRKPLFPILNIILPVMLMVVLNMFVLVLPAESGEKIGFAVTIMLALAVFLTIISSTIPSNSVAVSLLAIYLLMVQMISALILIVTVKNVQIFHRTGPVTPGYCKFVLFMRKKRCKGKKYSPRVKPEAEVGGGIPEKVPPPADDNPDVDPEVTWSEVTETLDCFFLCLFVLFAVLVTIIIAAFTISQPPLSKTALEVMEDYEYEDYGDWSTTTTTAAP